MSKKILQINAYYGFGSTGNILTSIENEGIKAGFDMYSIYWLCQNDNDRKNVYYLGNETDISSKEKIFEWIFKGGKLDYNRKITIDIINKIKEIDPDIIHLHNLHGDFEYGTLNLEKLFDYLSISNKKIVWTLHDCWPITGRCYHFEYKKCNKWKNGCGNCPQRIFDREGIFYDYSSKNWNVKKRLYQSVSNMTIVTVSDWLNSVVRTSILKDCDIKTIYNGIDTSVLIPREGEKNDDIFRILCIGWDRRKGFKDYYKLSKLLKSDEQIIVLGKRPIFRRSKKLPSNIVEIDRTNSKDKLALIYQNVDVYFNASPAETFGLTTVEAMSCGIPVIGYRNTATEEIISAVGGRRWLAEDRNINDVYRVVRELRKANIDRNQLHSQCNELFNESIMLGKYIKLYSRILEEENQKGEI